MKTKAIIFSLVFLALLFVTSCANDNKDVVVTEAMSETTPQTEYLPETIPDVSARIAETTPDVTTKPTETIPPTEPAVFSDDISFTCDYVTEDDFMPYALFIPSTANDCESIPLIVWLHGSGEKDVGEKTFLNNGLPKVLTNWSFEGFNAFVLCPHLKGEWNPGAWYLPTSKDNLKNLLDKFISEHNVDTDKIIITGHSLGGQGAMYMAHELPGYFSRLAVLSGYGPNIDISEIDIPTIGYVGMVYYGEAKASVRYMTNSFMPQFGEENTHWLCSSHGNLPMMAFNEDKDSNNRSDLVEWMLCDPTET